MQRTKVDILISLNGPMYILLRYVCYFDNIHSAVDLSEVISMNFPGC